MRIMYYSPKNFIWIGKRETGVTYFSMKNGYHDKQNAKFKLSKVLFHTLALVIYTFTLPIYDIKLYLKQLLLFFPNKTHSRYLCATCILCIIVQFKDYNSEQCHYWGVNFLQIPALNIQWLI